MRPFAEPACHSRLPPLRFARRSCSPPFVISCNSLLENLSEPPVEDAPGEVSWPMIVQGIRVYARQHPPSVAADLFELADRLSRIAEMQRDNSGS
jgi:hypothetical protein